MKSNDKFMFQSNGTVFYGPTYQIVIRMLLCLLTLMYFFFLPVPLFVLNLYFVYFTCFVYFCFHVLWWIRFRQHGITYRKMRMANWVDLATAGLAVVFDPYLVPPTIVLILIVVLGNGIQHGLRNFIIVAKNSVSVCLVIFPLHFFFCRQWPPYSFYFFSVFLISCGHYSFFLVKRIEKLKKHAERLAQRDELTGLLNRRAFLKSAQYLISLHNRIKIPLVLVFADLDNFKAVNDLMGHAIGDAVLEIFGNYARHHIRQTDIVARYGGDEFVFIFADSSKDNAEKILHRLETQFLDWAQTQNIQIGVSFGVKAVTEENVDLGKIMREADDALYEEKRKKGRGAS